MRIVLIVVLALLLLPAAVLCGMIAFFPPRPPPVLPFMAGTDATFASFVTELPPVRTFPARDGAALAFRLYEGGKGKGVAVLVHGSSGSSIAVHALAKALVARGVTVYAPDLRGHGDNGTTGDVAYIGQLEDDLADLSAFIAAARPDEKRVLLGHSQGGGLTLKMAAGPRANAFAGYVAASPFIGANTPMNRPGTGGWAEAAVPRIIALSLLNGFGVTAFNHLPVVAYAVPDDARGQRTRVNTFALLASASLDRDWQAALKRIARPCTVTIGEKDELFVAGAYAPNIAAANPAIKVEVIPAVGHMGSVLAPAALEENAKAVMALL